MRIMARIMRWSFAGVALIGCLVTAVTAADDLLPGERFRVRTLTFPYTEGVVFAMPREKLALAITAPPTRLFRVEISLGALTATGPNRWTWEAHAVPGRYPLDVKNPAGSKTVAFSAFVMVPSSEVRNGVLKGYHIGSYPETPLKGNPIYVPPKGLIEVTRDNEDTKVSPNFRIKEFVTKQKSGYPRYVVLDERLIFLLEAIGTHLEARGWDADDIFIMSGYRTPFYNK